MKLKNRNSQLCAETLQIEVLGHVFLFNCFFTVQAIDNNKKDDFSAKNRCGGIAVNDQCSTTLIIAESRQHAKRDLAVDFFLSLSKNCIGCLFDVA